ncbi:hypothetical protein L1049_011701 [Liquidambar formosana]|uniref:Uncharacterized protein n=1 Tax=Liquidambar formosana TaxID=63359 RepID=A0AAP0RX37_LIQFO
MWDMWSEWDFHFPFLEELWWIDSSMEEHKRNNLVSFLKICPSLERLSVSVFFNPKRKSTPWYVLWDMWNVREFHFLEELWWIESSIEKHKMNNLVSFLKMCPSLERLSVSVFFTPRRKSITPWLSLWDMSDMWDMWDMWSDWDFHFPFLEELWWIDSSMEEHKRNNLVSFLKICPSLERLSVSVSFFHWLNPKTLTFSTDFLCSCFLYIIIDQ